MVRAWENVQEGFLMLVIVFVLSHWRFLRLWATFPCHLHFILAFQAREGLHQLWALPWLLLVAFLLPGFFVTVLPRALRFWAGVFYPQAFCTLHSFPTFWHVFVTQMWAGTSHPGSCSVPALPKLFLPPDARSWTTHIVDTRPLVYQLHQCATKYRVTKLLNMFQPTYACLQTIETLWTRLVNKYCLKLLQWNCFLSINQS